jgi:hypothetical protein
MGEVIRGVFGKPSSEIPKNEDNGVPEKVPEKSNNWKEALIEKIENGTASDYELSIARLLMEALKGNEEVKKFVKSFMEVSEVLGGINKFIGSLSDFYPSNQVLATAEQQWMSLSDDELKGATLGSGEAEWGKDPSRYLALRREWFNRVKRKAATLE